MTNEIRKINALVEKLRSLEPMQPEDAQRLEKKFRLEFNYNSNHMEGNTLTYGETELLLIFDDTKGNHTFREYEEMKAHDVAYKLVQEEAADNDKPLTESFVKQLNEIILVRPFWKDAQTADGQATRRQIKVGSYKQYPNSVRLQNGEMFDYASPSDTPILMGELVQWYRQEEEKKELHPVELAALLHYKFVCIHPFDDGNGRISRLLMNYVLLRNNLPPVIIKSEDKKNYLFALHEADTGNLQAFVEYIVQQLFWSLETSIKAAKGESINEPGDFEKKLSLLKTQLGQNKNSSVIQKYNTDVIKEIIETTIKPLVDEWEIRLKEFDVFFFSRKNYVSFDDDQEKGNDIFDILAQLTTEYFYENASLRPKEIKTITLKSLFYRLRALKNDLNGYEGGEIKFSFHQNAFEINFTNSTESISKLYHEDYLTDKERNHIISTIGNFLLENIEQALNTDDN